MPCSRCVCATCACAGAAHVSAALLTHTPQALPVTVEQCTEWLPHFARVSQRTGRISLQQFLACYGTRAASVCVGFAAFTCERGLWFASCHPAPRPSCEPS